jgi:hypothetical protein
MALNGTRLANADFRQPQLRPLPEVAVPDIADVKEIRRLHSRLPDIARPGEEESGPINLHLFGYRKVEKVVASAVSMEKTVDEPTTYNLSFAFYSDRRRLCIINKTIYTEGKDLPDGARILKIESRRVLLDKNGHQEWIYME